MTEILIILFVLTMLGNIVALVRHWRMMRVMRIVLNNLIETQQQIAALNIKREPKPLVE